MAQGAIGDMDAALTTLAEALETARGITDPGNRAQALASNITVRAETERKAKTAGK